MILIAMVVIGIVLYAVDVFYYRRKDSGNNAGSAAGQDAHDGTLPGHDPDNEETTVVKDDDSDEEEGICCGMHTVCEKTNLSPLTGEIVYYDDEELDRYRGREADSYTPEETEEFRDVLLTLLPEDVAGWSRSIQVRGITLPADVRDELLLIVSELRRQ